MNDLEARWSTEVPGELTMPTVTTEIPSVLRPSLREHYDLDRLVEYGTELIPDAIEPVNPSGAGSTVKSDPRPDNVIV